MDSCGHQEPPDASVVRPQAEDDKDDSEIVEGSTVLAFVQLIKTPHE
jgi:hypothetical protein